MSHWGFPCGSVVKNLPASAGDLGLIPESGKIPSRRKWQPTPVFLPGKAHGQRSLMGYRPWCHKELDTTEHITFHYWELNSLMQKYFEKDNV